MTDEHLRTLVLLVAAMRAHDRAFGRDAHLVGCGECGATWHGHDWDACEWCAARWEARRLAALRPPPTRGYGYATPDDLERLGIDPTVERQHDLERWRHDMEIAVSGGLITESEGEQAWTKAITTSTGTSSTPASKPTSPSYPASPTAAAGRRSRPRRRPGNRRS